MTLPTFLVVGAYKSGTTALHDLLAAQPDVFVPDVKEPNFFAFDGRPDPANPAFGKAVTDLAGYEALFADVGSATAWGEVSPEYLTNPEAAPRIAARVPEVRLVAILRNPIDRAFSDFSMYVRDGLESERDFGRALDQQDARAARGDLTGFYVSSGFYGRQLQHYLAHFDPAQLHTELFEDFLADRAASLAAILGHLGVDRPPVLPEAVRRNVSGRPTSALARLGWQVRRGAGPVVRRVVPDRLVAGLTDRVDRVLARGLETMTLDRDSWHRLADVYRDDIGLLAELLGRDLSRWLEPPAAEARSEEVGG